MSLSKAKTFEIMEKESTSESDDDQNIPDIETISSEERHLISPFGKPNVIFTVENLELHLQKEHLTAESPVFEQMLNSDFMNLGITQIPLPGRTSLSSLVFHHIKHHKPKPS
jgi:hypothetical protein